MPTTATHSNPLTQRLRFLDPASKLAEAERFIRQYHEENGLGAEECERRLREVRAALGRHNHYDHTADELAFGARVAWRNHARCIGRVFWKSLVVVDRRDVTEPDEIAACCAEHLVSARGDGRIRSTITVFAPVRDREIPAHIESRQLTQYAGYLEDDGTIVGDPASIEATRTAIALGWQPPSPRTPFDLLPLQVCDARGRRHLYELPQGSTQEIAITHPAAPGLAALGLRWYAVPAVSSMVLTIGGIEYPCAPFNGFYMASEIASRNFIDATRYNLLEAAARALGIAPAGALWKDRVVTELNEAVLHSFEQAGVVILDHHTASEQFMEFFARERAAGREPNAEWSWIVPPQASSACPVYHLPMSDRHLVPNYYSSAATDGAKLGAHQASEDTVRSEDHAARSGDISRCPFARGLGLLARTMSKTFRHPVSLNSL